MAIATVLSGPFTSSYDSNSLGITEDGIRLAGSISKQTVTGDAHGDSIFDGVYRGGNWTVVLTSIEAIAARAAVEAYASLGVQGQVGLLDVGSSLAKSLVLNAVAGTPAATVVGSISTLTAPQSIVSENQQILAQGHGLDGS